MADDQQTEERTDEHPEEGQGEEAHGAAARAREKEEAWSKASETIREMEEQDEVPTDLKEWPDDEAKYITFGGGEGDHGYDEGPEKKLGPSSLERHEDGSITIEGEEVDNPDDYKSDPVEAAVGTPTPDDKDDDDGDDDERGEAESSADDADDDDSGDGDSRE